MARIWRLLVVVSLGVLLVACGAKVWEQDPMVQAARRACKDVGEVDRYACIERHAVEGLSPDVCRLLGIAVDDACLQSVYEAAGDPTICDRLYLEGVRPTCRAYYAARVPPPTATPLPSPSAFPTLTTTSSPTRTPSSTPTGTPYTAPGTNAVVSCDQVYPGLRGCNVYIEPLVGVRLAFVDPRPGLDSRPNVMDLGSGDHWVLGEEPSGLVAWSPSGDYLLTSQAQGEYRVYSYDGSVAADLHGQSAQPFWAPPDAFFGAVDWLAIPTTDGALQAMPFPQGKPETILPAGSLGSDGRSHVLWSGEGRLAWSLSLDQLTEAGGLEQTLQVGSAAPLEGGTGGSCEIVTWRLSDDARQAYYQILDWVPGTSLLLAAKGTMANSLWSWGVPLATINADTAEIRELGAFMLLTPESRAWHPTHSGLLALAEGGGRYLTDPNRLALLDVTSGVLRPLTDEGMSVFEPAWSPDGRLLAYSAVSVPADAQGDGAALERMLEGRAIYVVDPESGETRALTNPGAAIDGWPQWSADSSRLLYTRQHDGYTDVHVMRQDGVSDKLLLTGMPDPTCFYGGCGWGQMLAYHADTVGDVIRVLLRDYSHALSSGQIVRPEFYSPAMRDLIAERRAYYQEFHQMALHSSLLGISSRYKLDAVAPDAVEDGLYHVQAVEMVTTTGRYREPTPEECTSTRAALWALARTDHPAVQKALQEYITREMARYLARFDTVSSFDTVWIVRHHLLIRTDENGFTVVQDTFDDKASDNTEGFDVVSWVDGRFVRHRPDWAGFPDYEMYHEPLEKVESLGRSLLQDKTRTVGGTSVPDPHPDWLMYTHSIYGFSFRHPSDWTVVSRPDVPNLIWLRYGEPTELELTIGFCWPGEEAPIRRTGVGAGEIETQGAVRFLGRDLLRQVLIYEGRVKAILYNNAQETDVDGLIFTLSLDARSLDYDAAQIEPAMQAIANEIIESFLLSSD